jgi:hypothetical protein
MATKQQNKFNPGDIVKHEDYGEGKVELVNAPWVGVKLNDGAYIDLYEAYLSLVRKRGARKPKPIQYNMPDELWIMAYHTHNSVGSISHVSNGEKFYTSKKECQDAIDAMPGWIGMGDRSKYRPLCIVKAK